MRRRKPQRYAQRVAWKGNARQLGLNWRATVAMISGEAVVIAFLALWPHMIFREGAVGFSAGAVAGAMAVLIARFDDPQVRGDLAEQWTAEALGDVRGWQVTNSLVFADGDLDHVVVTPSGVLAVETKYRFAQPDRRRLTEQRTADLAAAERAGRKAGSLLRSKDIGRSAAVTPVLVVWGKGKADLPDGYKLVGDVYVVDGNHPRLWSPLFNAPLLPQETRDSIHDALTAYQRRQIDRLRGEQISRRRLCWQEFWAGVREEREQHLAKKKQKEALRRRHGALASERI